MEALREWLSETETTQVELAKQVGVSQATVSDWVKGNIKPSPSNFVVLSRVTSIPIERLVRQAAAA